MSDNKIIILAILIIGVSFFYANLGGVTGDYKRVTPFESSKVDVGARWTGGGETQCVVGQNTCNNGGSGMGKQMNRYGDIVRCVSTSQGGSKWELVKSCDKANPCTLTKYGPECRYALGR